MTRRRPANRTGLGESGASASACARSARAITSAGAATAGATVSTRVTTGSTGAFGGRWARIRYHPIAPNNRTLAKMAAPMTMKTSCN